MNTGHDEAICFFLEYGGVLYDDKGDSFENTGISAISERSMGAAYGRLQFSPMNRGLKAECCLPMNGFFSLQLLPR